MIIPIPPNFKRYEYLYKNGDEVRTIDILATIDILKNKINEIIDILNTIEQTPTDNKI